MILRMFRSSLDVDIYTSSIRDDQQQHAQLNEMQMRSGSRKKNRIEMQTRIVLDVDVDASFDELLDGRYVSLDGSSVQRGFASTVSFVRLTVTARCFLVSR